MNNKNYYRIMLGAKSAGAKEAIAGNYIGVHYGMDIDLTGKLPDDWRDFNRNFIPIYLDKHPDNPSKVAAGLACGTIYTVSKGMKIGDIVISPTGQGSFYVGEVIGEYEYHKDTNAFHRRPVKWSQRVINREEISDDLRHSMGSIGTLCNITKYADEIEKLIRGDTIPSIVTTDQTIEDPSVFALEKHLEDFLVHNWKHTELGKNYDIYKSEGQIIGQQYPTDTGPIDILAISQDKKVLLVVELKRGRVSDVVVGQTQRYMGYVKEVLAEPNQTVRGTIIAFEDDLRIQRALSVAPNIDFYTYKIRFTLEKK